MRQELLKLMKDIDAAAARMNAGLGAVATVLTLVLGATVTVKLAVASQALLDSHASMLLGP